MFVLTAYTAEAQRKLHIIQLNLLIIFYLGSQNAKY